MSVLLEQLISNVIVMRSAIERSYPGGIAQFEQDVPNRSTYCADRHLVRVGFMDDSVLEEFVRELEGRVLMGELDFDPATASAADVFSIWHGDVPEEILLAVERLRELGPSYDLAIDLTLERLRARLQIEYSADVPDAVPEWFSE